MAEAYKSKDEIRAGNRLSVVQPDGSAPSGSGRPKALMGRIKQYPLINWLFLIGTVIYAVAFVRSLKWWFDPGMTTDDALQQIFQFHEVQNPGIFPGDLIYETMKGYLAPIHYWICYGITALTGDPIMMGHWVMLIQVLYAVTFVFLAVKSLAGTAPALFSVAWLLHTRNIIQRMTAGLPRGWAAGLLASYIYFVVRGNHWGVLVTLLIGCLLNPPATVIMALSYGLLLLWRVARADTRQQYKKHLIRYLILSPLFLLVTFNVVKRPPEVGQMITLSQAEAMPEFDRPGGRFDYLPFLDAWTEIKNFGLQTFISRWYSPPQLLRENMVWIVLGLFLVASVLAARKRRIAVPAELTFFLVSIFTVYFASRELAFLLYVPNRHLQFPLAIFLIIALPVALWRALVKKEGSAQLDRVQFGAAWPAAVALIALAGLIYAGSVDGLRGAANFNYPVLKRGNVFRWIAKNSAQDALIAGNPTHIDALHLFGKRRAFATTETAHPFYPKYYAEIKRRLIISWRANYATSLEEFVGLLAPEGVDYFVFRRADFYPDALKNASYFKPLDSLVHELASRPAQDYLFKKLPRDGEATPNYVVFRDSSSVIVDVNAAKEYLAASKAKNNRVG